ncbi:PPA1309 family protein [Jatrophihabitans sp. DSM 45814]
MTHSSDPAPAASIMLEAVAAEIEAFANEAGWDSAPLLFALVPTRSLAADPGAAALLSIDGTSIDPAEIDESAITPIAQEDLPEGALDEVLAQIGWPDEVIGCAVSQEILMLPPSVEGELDDLAIDAAVNVAVDHPQRREARLVVAVLRDGRSACILRLRSVPGAETGDDLLTGTDLAPNLAAALSATLSD